MAQKTGKEKLIEQLKKDSRSMSWLASQLGIGRSAVSLWPDEIPSKHVLAVEELSGVSRHILNPTIYGPSPQS